LHPYFTNRFRQSHALVQETVSREVAALLSFALLQAFPFQEGPRQRSNFTCAAQKASFHTLQRTVLSAYSQPRNGWCLQKVLAFFAKD